MTHESESTVIQISQFGQALASRPEGREAALATKAYHVGDPSPSSLILDFSGVLIMTPSWLSEYVQTLQSQGIKQISFVNTDNPTVGNSIDLIQQEESDS